MNFQITFATQDDIPIWMDLVHIIKDGFPGLIEEDYLKLLKKCIAEKRALIIKDKSIAIGIMAFSYDTKSIDFLGVHPEYRQQGIAKTFLKKVMEEFLRDSDISVTTFRKGDKANNGSREVCKKLGFAERELLVEFGYPTQKFLLKNSSMQTTPLISKTSKSHIQETNNKLAQKFGLRSLLQFAFPTIFMMIFIGLYTIVDTVFVSKFVNTNALSAINIVCPVINITVGLGTMLATGGSAIIARKMGSGDEKGGRENFTLIILTGIIIGLLITSMGIIFLDEIIRNLGASYLLFPYCYDYLFILLLFAPFSILQVLFQNFFVTAGKPSMGLWLVIGSGVTNALLDYIFIVPMQMGIKGAALGTSIGYIIPSIAGIIFFSHNKEPLHFCNPKLDLKMLGQSCFNGSSEMVGQLSAAVTTFLFNTMMMELLGEDGVAAITIIIYSQFLLTTLYMGFSIGVAPVISYNYGSKNTMQLKLIFYICILFISIASLLIFVTSMLCAPVIVNIFSPKGTNVYDIARAGFTIFPFSFLFCGYNIFTSAMFTALSNGKISSILSFLRTFAFITVGLLVLPHFLKVTGIWLAVPLAELLTLFLSVAFIYRYRTTYHYI